MQITSQERPPTPLQGVQAACSPKVKLLQLQPLLAAQFLAKANLTVEQSKAAKCLRSCKPCTAAPDAYKAHWEEPKKARRASLTPWESNHCTADWLIKHLNTGKRTSKQNHSSLLLMLFTSEIYKPRIFHNSCTTTRFFARCCIQHRTSARLQLWITNLE